MSFLTRVSLANRAVVALLSLLVIGVGLFATTNLKQELFPSLEIPSATVISAYQGASPDAVERQVTEPIEDAVKGVAGVTSVTSTTLNGVSQVTAQWDFDGNSDKIRGDIDAAVNGLQSLPQNVKPRLTSGSLADIPIVVLSVASDEPAATLSKKLQDVAVPKLSGLDGVRAVSVSGARENQVVVTFRPADVTRLGVQPATLQQALQANNLAVPAGDIDVRGKQLNVQVGQSLTGVKDVAALRLQGTDGPVRLDTVADVEEAPAATTSLSRTDGRPSLSVVVVKEADGNTVTVAHEVRDALPGIAAQLGGKASFSTVFDQAPFIEESIDHLATEGVLGLVFAVLVIFVFLLSVRPTIIAAISIPLSLLIAMIGLWQTGETLNIFTLGALTVAIGRVVDDSIVVIENIKRHLGDGERGVEAIVSAVREVAGAVTASTITTVAVFLPLGLVSGEVGELFRPFAVTVTIALLASLLVALTIVPVLAWWFMTPSSSGRRGFFARRGRRERPEPVGHDHEAETGLQRVYLPVLRWSLAHRLLTLALAVLIFVGTMALTPKLRTDFLGDAGQNSLSITQTLPSGTALTATDAAAKKAEGVLRADPAVQTVQTTVGGGGAASAGFGPLTGQNSASMQVMLKTGENGTAVAERLRSGLTALSGAGEFKVSAGGGAAGSTDVQIKVTGSDLTTLRTGSDQVVAMLKRLGGLQEVRSDLSRQQQQLQVNIDPAKAAAVGLTQTDVGAAVAAALSGTPGGQIRVGESTQDILVRSREPVTTAAQLADLTLPVTQKQTIDAQKAAGERVADKQQAAADQQQAQAQAQAADQLAQLRKGRDAARAQVATLTTQLGRLQGALAQAQAAQQQAQAEQRATLERVRRQVQDVLDALNRQAATPPPGAPTLSPTSTPDPTATTDATPGEPGDTASPTATSDGDVGAASGAASAAPTALPTALPTSLPTRVPPLPTPLPNLLPGGDPTAQIKAQIGQLQQGIAAARAQADQLDKQLVAAQEAQAKGQAQARAAEDLADEAKAAQKVTGTAKLLKDVATITTVSAPATITRVDGVRSVTVSATPTAGDLSQTSAALQSGLDGLRLPAGVSASIGGVSQDQQEAFRQLGLAMAVAIAIVFLVMVATFRSLVQPLILLVSIPFAATGAVGLLLLSDTALGLPAMIGLLMLIGIVVTNAIVLIDLVNQYRDRGVGIEAAIIDGARLRLRPIIMTAMATICALIPMALGLTGGGVFISKPLAIVVIGGLVSSTLLTLLLVPVLYDLVEHGRRRASERRARRRGDDDTDAAESTEGRSSDGVGQLFGDGDAEPRPRSRFVPRPGDS